MILLLQRIFQAGWLSFKKQGLPTLATVFVMLITVSLVSSFFLLAKVSAFLISELEEKVDISAYFKEDASPDQILAAKEQISQNSLVRDVKYVSSERARVIFIERHRDDPVLLESLWEVGNPFLASLNIKAWRPEQYEEIVDFVENSSFQNLIEKIDYYQRKTVIERIFSLTSGLHKGLIFLSLVLGVVAVLVTFNTVRLAIYSNKSEIGVQRLVGASDWFIRGPFLVQGGISGFLAALISLLIFGVSCFGLTSQFQVIFPGLNLFSYFKTNVWPLFLIQLSAGIGLGVFSSFIAVRKYLEI